MGKKVIIAEKPSVAREFAKVLNINGKNQNGYIESEEYIVTWCVGHLVTMSYPEKYDEKLRYWNLKTLPFIPEEFKYEIIDNVSKQFVIISNILNREDVETRYECMRQALVFDLYYRENSKSRPAWTNDMGTFKSITHFYCKNGKMSHIEPFSYNFLEDFKEFPVAQNKQLWVLYSYDKRDVLSHQAKVEYVNPEIDMYKDETR